MNIDSDTIKRFPPSFAAGVVLRAFDGDSPERGYPGTRNAWDVLAAAFGRYPAYLHLVDVHPNGVDGADALLKLAGVPIPQREPIVVEVPVRIAVDLHDYNMAYSVGDDYAAMLDAQDHMPNLIREEVVLVLRRIGYGDLLPES